jgi:nucleotide-binding universal stress UspA family protein
MDMILIAVDGSPASDEGMAFGVELAEEQDAALTFVQVAPLFDVAPVMGFPMVGAAPHVETAQDRAALDRAVVYAAEHGLVADTKLLAGDAVDEIVAYADSLGADLIVVGSRGHGAMATALLGSVSRGILHESRRPVVVVRGAAASRAAPAPALCGQVVRG